ncbi:cytidine deaminase-like protein [Tirmania nivea]|nr:cytidine deaminase-like protein [Tirmania nivea]
MENSKPHSDSMAGKVYPLHTFMEHKAAVETVEVYTVPVPAKKANAILNALREVLPPQNKSGLDLQHLRRLVREEFLAKQGYSPPKKPVKQNILYLLIAPKTAIELTTIYGILRPLLFPSFPEVSTIEVPLHASISQEQADEWSTLYWPAIYKRGNPFGPHPPYVEQTINKTLPKVPEYMKLVREVAKQALNSGNGIEVGALVVDPSNEEVVAIAGDGRHMTFGADAKTRGCTWGNPLEHAVMRVVGMVAAKRKLREDLEIGTKDTATLIDTEKKGRGDTSSPICNHIYRSTNVFVQGFKETGEYLCHNHIVYLTHEPCVMCSMALIHSRIGMVVIDGRKKADSGGSGSEAEKSSDSGMGAGYGLFWRKELNWKFLAFEWIENGEREEINGHDFYA